MKQFYILYRFIYFLYIISATLCAKYYYFITIQIRKLVQSSPEFMAEPAGLLSGPEVPGCLCLMRWWTWVPLCPQWKEVGNPVITSRTNSEFVPVGGVVAAELGMCLI